MRRTSTTTGSRQGDIVLVSFPFTDLTSSKRRPALVISPDSFNAAGDDLVPAAISCRRRLPHKSQMTPMRSTCPAPTFQKGGFPRNRSSSPQYPSYLTGRRWTGEDARRKGRRAICAVRGNYARMGTALSVIPSPEPMRAKSCSITLLTWRCRNIRASR